MICSVEEKTATAQYEHLNGAYFRYNDTLYVATTDISKGDTIVPNVNCRTTDVASSLTSKYFDISAGANDYVTLLSATARIVGPHLAMMRLQMHLKQAMTTGVVINWTNWTGIPSTAYEVTYGVMENPENQYLGTAGVSGDRVTLGFGTNVSTDNDIYTRILFTF